MIESPFAFRIQSDTRFEWDLPNAAGMRRSCGLCSVPGVAATILATWWESHTALTATVTASPVMNKATATATSLYLEVTAMTCGVSANGA